MYCDYLRSVGSEREWEPKSSDFFNTALKKKKLERLAQFPTDGICYSKMWTISILLVEYRQAIADFVKF